MDTADKKTLGQYIRERRDELDLSLREFARKIECSASFVSDMELGRRYPSKEVLKNMAKVLDESIENLKSYDSRPPLEQIKKAVEQNPMYAFALRKIIDKDIKADELMKFANQNRKRKK
jgi:transcriptional regulator with XRE-family HTH domain